MQCVHIDVGRFGLEECSVELLGAQNRAEAERFLGIQAARLPGDVRVRGENL